MKKIYSGLLLFFLVFTGTLRAQSFVVIDQSGNDITGDTIRMSSSSIVDELSYHAYVINTSQSAKSVVVQRTNINLPAGMTTYFCWSVTCYLPTTSVSPDTEFLNPGDTATSFIGYSNPNASAGTVLVKYEFFEDGNMADVAHIYIEYTFGSTGVEASKPQYSLSAVYPNPARDVVNFNYTLSSGDHAEIALFDLSGKKVKSLNLTSGDSYIKADVSGLNSGVYFYTLYLNGRAVLTKRVVISK